MTREPEEIACPKYPDHGRATKRWLPADEREFIRDNNVRDVFEVDCPRCGKYEHRDLPIDRPY